uniref:Tryptophan synthase-related n=1 Tax=Arundo donax TaxID=35708 RepID=A0A0A9EEK9_ARUDO
MDQISPDRCKNAESHQLFQSRSSNINQSYFRDGSQGGLQLVRRVRQVDHVASQVLLVRGEVEVAVAAHGHQDHLLLPGPLALQRLPDRRRDRVRRLRRRDDALRPSELQRSLEAFGLLYGDCIHESELIHVRDQRCHSMVAKPTCMDWVGDEAMAEGVHLHERRQPRRVAEVVGVDALGERRARRGLHGPERRAHPAAQLLAHEREREPAEVGPAAGAADDDVGRLTERRQLLQALLPDDGLVEQDVVQHAAEAVLGVGVGGRHLHRLGDGDPKAAGAGRVRRQDLLAGLRRRRRRRVHLGAPRLHHQPPVRLLVVRRAHLPHLAVEAEEAAGEGERAAPLAGAGLSDHVLHPSGGVVPRLRHGGVGLVRPRRTGPLVLVVDLRRRAEQLFQPRGPDQRRRAPELVYVDDLLRYVDEPLVGDLLPDQLVGEQRGQVAGAQGLVRLRVQRRRRLHRQVGDEVVPLLRDAHLGARIGAGPRGEAQGSSPTGSNSVLRRA